MKTRKPFLKVSLIIATVTMMVLATTPFTIGQNWYNSNWQYRRLVTVPNSNSLDLSNFQVQITLNSSFDFNKAKIDGSDVIITENDGTTLLPFWIETWNKAGTQASIWVKVSDIPTPAGTTVFMYYGNPSATSLSNGNSTFEFFDDFRSSITYQPGYYAFGPASTIMIQDQSWETSAPHSLSAVNAPSGASYTYYGYYGPQNSGWIGIAGSNDLLNWTKLSQPINPLFSGHGERWPSVFRDGNTYFMVHTMNYTGPSYLVYRTSPDGLSWSTATTIIQDGYNNQNPSLFHDPNNGQYYLYWYRSEGGWRIMYKTASTVADLVTATSNILLTSSTTLAAPNMMYYDNTYFLSTEIFEGNVWKVRIYSGTSPSGPFTILPGNPVLSDGCACLFQTPYGNTIYEYYCKQATNGSWTLDMRVVDPGTGRIMYEQGNIDPAKWTASGGTWTIVSDLQQDGTVGFVAQGNTSGNQILKSSFFGSDYVLEGWGRQISGNVWGFGVRTTNAQNTYSLNVYDNHDSEENLYFYRWQGGSAITAWRTALGTINPNTWYKLKVKAYSNNFDIYFNDVLKTTASNSSFSSGSISLYGESGTNAQYNDVRVRKYVTNDPSTSVGGEQSLYPPLQIAFDKTDVSCFGGSNGAINISVSGGATPYIYTWTASAGGVVPGGQSSNEDLTDLVAGTYSVTVTAANGSNGTINVNIIQPSALIASYSIAPSICNDGTTTVTISATGGTPFQSGGYTGTGNFQQSEGTVVYYVTDANGCQTSVSVTVNAFAPWYNPGWQYRYEVTVSNPGGTELNEFQIKVTLDETFDFDNARSDGSDIRFTSDDGVTIIPYWIEAWNKEGNSAILWVKVPIVPTSGTTVFLYYGNTTAVKASNGNNTFDFFDDFESSITTQPGYYNFGPASTIMVQDQSWESSAPHTLSVVRAPTSGAYNNYTYYGYYGPQNSGWVGMAGSNDLLNWTKFPQTINPILSGHGVRWPSVYWDNTANKYYMVHTMNYGSSYLVYRESADGLTWTDPTTIVPYDVSNQNPALFHDPVSNKYYLYWYRAANGWSIMAREAATVAGLVTASNIELLRSSTTLAAPQVLYYDNTYFLSTEIMEGVWKVRIYAGTSPLGPFTVLPGNPVLGDGCACLFQHLFDGNIYEYYCKETNGTWTLDMRVVDPSTGRIMYEEGLVDPSKWTPEGGNWSIKSAVQQDGTTGIVAEGITTTNSILKSSFSGTDYILEGYGKQIAGPVWGLGVRTTNTQNTYTLNLYEALDDNPIGNLHFYRWKTGFTTQDVWYTGLGTIDLNTWYKLQVKAHGNAFDIYFNDVLKTTATDNTWASGSIALYGENGTIAQFNDVRVRKYASQEPTTSVSFLQSPPLSITFIKTDVSVNGGSDGAIDITVTGGSGSYTYLWSPGNQTTQDLTGIPAGNYSVIVTDGYGCIASQNVVITEPTSIPVSGIIQYNNSVPIPLQNTIIKLKQGGADKYTSTPTNSFGQFSFTNVVAGTYDVEFIPGYPPDGINSTDAAQVNYWGTGGLSYPIERVRFLAGDVTFDNNIASVDAGRILQYFLTQGNPPLSSPWCFWKTGEEMIGSNPWSFGNLTITVTGSGVSQNFYGLATGDFNQSYVPGSLKSGSESLMLVYGETLEVVPGMEFQLTLSAVMDMNVGAVSLIIDFPSDLLDVNGVYLADDPDAPVMYAVSGDELRIAWNSLDPVFVSEGESLLTLLLKVKDLTPEEGIRIKLAADPLNELADGNYEVISDAVLSVDIVKTVTTGTGEITLSDRLSFANHPNPFTGKTTFAYSLPVDGKVTLEVYDIVGNKVKSLVDETQSAGDYQLKIDENSLQAGVYTATLKLDSNGNLMTRTIKIICKY